MKSIFTSACLLILTVAAQASPAPFTPLHTLHGRVVHITDGDSLSLQVEGRPELKIRLWGIDCPEWRQPYTRQATKNARRLATGAEVTVDVQGTDKYGRSLGWVHLPSGQTLNEAQVQAGLAWWYEHYSPEALGLRDMEKKAREAKLGLWGAKDPVAPWDWRHRRR